MIFIACVTYYVRAVTLLYIEARNDIKVSYNKLWKLLIDRKMKRVQLRDTVGISSFTLARLGRDECVSMRILLKICEKLNCNIGDIVKVLPYEVICQSQNIQRMQNGKHE